MHNILSIIYEYNYNIKDFYYAIIVLFISISYYIRIWTYNSLEVYKYNP